MSLAESHPQNDFINAVRKEHKRVEVYLINGIRLVGYIESFDQYLVTLRTSVGLQAIYKRAISTIQLDTGTRPGSKPRQSRPEYSEREHGQPQRRGPYSHGTREFRESREFRDSREPSEPGDLQHREPGEPETSAQSHEPHDAAPHAPYSSSSTSASSFFTTTPERTPSSRPVVITRRRRVWSGIKDNGSDER